MKKIFLLLFLFIGCISFRTIAQKKKTASVNSLITLSSDDENKKEENGNSGNKELRIISAGFVMEMKIPEGGANGASVVYHPKEKLYYAAQAGNKIFPLIIFDKNGTVVSKEGQQTLVDVRGLWYNPKTKKIGGNGYDQNGWFHYELNKNGLPENIDVFKEGMYQPGKNSAGVLNTDDDEVLFLDGLNVVCYKTDGTDKQKVIQIHFGASNAKDNKVSADDFDRDYNTMSLIYTGIKGAEIGFLNVAKKQVELYDSKSGYMSQIIKIPASFKIETFFNFSYSNGIYWLFDKDKRKWMGYK